MIVALLAVLVIATIVGSMQVGGESTGTQRRRTAQRARYLAAGLGVFAALVSASAAMADDAVVAGALVPAAICAIPALVGLSGHVLVSNFATCLVAVAGLGFVYLAGMTIGLLFAPAALALVAACVIGVGRSRSQSDAAG